MGFKIEKVSVEEYLTLTEPIFVAQTPTNQETGEFYVLWFVDGRLNPVKGENGELITEDRYVEVKNFM